MGFSRDGFYLLAYKMDYSNPIHPVYVFELWELKNSKAVSLFFSCALFRSCPRSLGEEDLMMESLCISVYEPLPGFFRLPLPVPLAPFTLVYQ